MRFVPIILFLLSLGIVLSTARAETIYGLQDTKLGATGGLKINGTATTCAAAQYTGWVKVNQMKSITWDIDFVDGAGGAGVGNVTAITWTCQTARPALPANGAGRIQGAFNIVCAARLCTATGAPLLWSWPLAVGANSEKFTQTNENIAGPYINCLFTCAGAPDANDNISVYARGITP